MDKNDLERRTKAFAIKIVKFVEQLPAGKTKDVLGFQLLKSDTSIGANYREANRAESRNDFMHKVAIATKEAAETQYWLEICEEIGLGNAENLNLLHQESTELLAIFTTIGKNIKKK
jgi:four helix bundle protein